jgi:hypothetical protein
MRKWISQSKFLPDWTRSYKLPDLLKHAYIALRFLPQASYEQAAQMRVSPVSNVVTRALMLLRCVAPGNLDLR